MAAVTMVLATSEPVPLATRTGTGVGPVTGGAG